MKRILFGRKKVRWTVRIVRTLMLTFVVCWGLYLWQPYVIDFIPRQAPPSKPILFSDTNILKRSSRVLVVTAHPDDDAYYIGGTLLELKRHGAIIQNVVITNGDKRFYFYIDGSKMTRTRQAEQRAASQFYGAREPIFLGEPDGRTKMNDHLEGLLRREIERFSPTAIICFDAEYPRRISHRDHRNSGRAVFAAAQAMGFDGWILMFETLAPNTACDITDVWNDKVELFKCYRSQYTPKRMPHVVNSSAAGAERTGKRFGLTLAEPFRAVKLAKN